MSQEETSNHMVVIYQHKTFFFIYIKLYINLIDKFQAERSINQNETSWKSDLCDCWISKKKDFSG